MNSKLKKLTSFFCDFTHFERSRYVPTECLSPTAGLCIAGGVWQYSDYLLSRTDRLICRTDRQFVIVSGK